MEEEKGNSSGQECCLKSESPTFINRCRVSRWRGSPGTDSSLFLEWDFFTPGEPV